MLNTWTYKKSACWAIFTNVNNIEIFDTEVSGSWMVVKVNYDKTGINHGKIGIYK